jgi:hypothetical protein
MFSLMSGAAGEEFAAAERPDSSFSAAAHGTSFDGAHRDSPLKTAIWRAGLSTFIRQRQHNFSFLLNMSCTCSLRTLVFGTAAVFSRSSEVAEAERICGASVMH